MRAASAKATAATPPSLFHALLEARALFEAGACLLTWPFMRHAHRGDGHRVIVFPGLAAGDMSTWPMRHLLASLGYDVRGWGLGLNRGLSRSAMETLLEQIDALYRASNRAVSLVGWSLGGIYARELAKLRPDKVRCVVTLASPLQGTPRATRARHVYRLLSGHDPETVTGRERLAEAPPVPCTSIYSRSDGIVSWRASVQRTGSASESVEVFASHMGIGMNPLAWLVVADRLAKAPGAWQPFRRVGWRAYVFPAAVGA